MAPKLSITLPGISDLDDLQKHILDNGVFTREENLRIFNKWFKDAPRYMYKAVNRKYRIANKITCDVGCTYGMNLVFAAAGSYGVEIEEYPARFAKSIGLEVERRNIFDDISDLPKVEVVWCSAVLEHVESPHIFLRKLHQLLIPNGMVIVFVPTVPAFPALRYLTPIKKYLTGHLYSDHINAFTPETLRFFCERAGFKTIETSPFYPFPLSPLNHVPFVKGLIDGSVYIGEKIENWEYPIPNSTRRVANNIRGFDYVGDTGFPKLEACKYKLSCAPNKLS